MAKPKPPASNAQGVSLSGEIVPADQYQQRAATGELGAVLETMGRTHNGLTLMREIGVVDRLIDHAARRYDMIMVDETLDMVTRLKLCSMSADHLQELIQVKARLAEKAVMLSVQLDATITPDRVPQVVDDIAVVFTAAVKKIVPRTYQRALLKEVADELRQIASRIIGHGPRP